MKTPIELENNECRFPFGEDAPFLFCAEVKKPGSSYCAEHHAMCWDRVRPVVAKARVYRGTDFSRSAA